MTHKQNLYKKTKQNKIKQRKETHTCNSLDSKFDKDFYYGFHEHQIT